MINDLEINIAQQLHYDQHLHIHSFHIDSINDLDQIHKKIRVSSICYQLKKKLKKKTSRPSLQNIEDSVRNVKIFSVVPSQTNLDNLENEMPQL